jgi:hypothetical protein
MEADRSALRAQAMMSAKVSGATGEAYWKMAGEESVVA